jgi:hypothetical protein
MDSRLQDLGGFACRRLSPGILSSHLLGTTCHHRIRPAKTCLFPVVMGSLPGCFSGFLGLRRASFRKDVVVIGEELCLLADFGGQAKLDNLDGPAK